MHPKSFGSIAAAFVLVATAAPAFAFCDHKHPSCCCKTGKSGQVTAPAPTPRRAAAVVLAPKASDARVSVTRGGGACAVAPSGQSARGASARSTSCESTPARSSGTGPSSGSGCSSGTTIKAKNSCGSEGQGLSLSTTESHDAPIAALGLTRGTDGNHSLLVRAVDSELPPSGFAVVAGEGAPTVASPLAVAPSNGPGEAKAALAPEAPRVRSLLSRVRAPESSTPTVPSEPSTGSWARVAEAPCAPSASESTPPTCGATEPSEANGTTRFLRLGSAGQPTIEVEDLEELPARVDTFFAEAFEGIEMPEIEFDMPEFDFEFDVDSEDMSPEAAEELRAAREEAMESARAAHAEAMQAWQQHQQEWRESQRVWQAEARERAKEAIEHAREQQKHWAAQARQRNEEFGQRARAEARAIEEQNRARANELRKKAQEFSARAQAEADAQRDASGRLAKRLRSDAARGALPERIARLENELAPGSGSEHRSLEERVAELEKRLNERHTGRGTEGVAPEARTYFLGRDGRTLFDSDGLQKHAVRLGPGVHTLTPDGKWKRLDARPRDLGPLKGGQVVPDAGEDADDAERVRAKRDGDELRSEIEAKMKELKQRMEELRQRMQSLRSELQESGGR